MPDLFDLYFKALMNGNPLAVAFAAVVAVTVSVGPFYEGISDRDPVAIAMAVAIGLMFAFVLTILIVDRRSRRKKTRQGSLAPRR